VSGFPASTVGSVGSIATGRSAIAAVLPPKLVDPLEGFCPMVTAAVIFCQVRGEALTLISPLAGR
jgi:hypothetical protein